MNFSHRCFFLRSYWLCFSCWRVIWVGRKYILYLSLIFTHIYFILKLQGDENDMFLYTPQVLPSLPYGWRRVPIFDTGTLEDAVMERSRFESLSFFGKLKKNKGKFVVYVKNCCVRRCKTPKICCVRRCKTPSQMRNYLALDSFFFIVLSVTFLV